MKITCITCIPNFLNAFEVHKFLHTQLWQLLTYAQGNKYFTVSGSFAYGKQNETGVETVKDRKKSQLKIQLSGIKSRNY